MIIIIALSAILFCLLAFILFCCLASGHDSSSQEISDKEQIEYIRAWMKKQEKH